MTVCIFQAAKAVAAEESSSEEESSDEESSDDEVPARPSLDLVLLCTLHVLVYPFGLTYWIQSDSCVGCTAGCSSCSCHSRLFQ